MTISEKDKIIQSLKMYAGQDLSETVVMKERVRNQLVPVEIVENYETRTLTQRVKIPARKMLDKSSLRYTIHFIDSNNMVVGKYKGKESYNRELKYLSRPVIKPGVSASWAGDSLHVSYVQNDPSGVKIVIYFRSLDSAAPFKILKTISTNYLDSGEVRESYKKGISSRTLIRAISFSASDTPCAFTDCISAPQEKMGIFATPMVPSTQFGVSQVGSVFRIKYNIKGLTPGGPARVFLLKRAYLVGKNGRSAFLGEHEGHDITDNPDSTISDSSLIDGQYYEYSLVLRNGYSPSTDVRINANNVLVRYISIPDWVSVKATSISPRTSLLQAPDSSGTMSTIAAPGSQFTDVDDSTAQVRHGRSRPNYELTIDLFETKTDQFFKFLKTRGMEDFYSDELKMTREKLAQFLVFKAERTSKGKTVDLGFFLPGVFKDPRPVSLQCVYSFKLYAGNKTHILESLRAPTNSNIPDYLLEDSRAASLQEQTNLKASKTIFNIGNSEYSSVHESSNISGNTFDLHYTGAQAKIRYEPAGSRTARSPLKPVDIRLTRLRNGVNRISWGVNNGVVVDHFIITSKSNGSLSIAGTAHHLSSNDGRYVFYDERFSDAIGTISYGIIAVSTAIVISNPVFSNSITMR